MKKLVRWFKRLKFEFDIVPAIGFIVGLDISVKNEKTLVIFLMCFVVGISLKD